MWEIGVDNLQPVGMSTLGEGNRMYLNIKVLNAQVALKQLYDIVRKL